MTRQTVLKKLKIALLALTPALLFALLLFSEPISLFGWSDNGDNGTAKEDVSVKPRQFDYINIEIDSTLGYRPALYRSGLIYDQTDNRLVWEKNLEEQFPIASLTKMMVALITIEHIDAGTLKMSDKVHISKYATWVGGSKVYLRAGQQVTVSDLLHATLIRSGNDAAYALAEHIGGTEQAFVRAMNLKAESLGMDHTCYANSTGMPVKSRTLSDNASTVGDLLLLARKLVKYDGILEMTSESTDQIRNAKGIYTYSNRNTLAKKYEEVDGLKTGYTNAAKYCIVATANRCGHRVITIMLGVGSKRDRFDVAVNLFNNYYSSIGLGKLGENLDDTACTN